MGFIKSVFLVLCAFGLFVWFSDNTPNFSEIAHKGVDTLFPSE